ncbi:MAG TPA: tRNA (guanosine(37)-N1)-methyltransferase TrmD [Anaerolineaceae bacterium]|uniref:tRNA (guanine-N(1)-)-methyltransferase n=1 Tax=Anaerolinea thermophila TaxID=167964 RepID=A0A101FYB3_9CHLR|nr:MAG: tRNA (guanine-N(1)-)-methyltransferase [Anaerolinea thermophila]HAF62474.1 tRNA (guanosine(37)-N1)-methyltransferase TrmD [Anaerolineaceae bacterium]
MRFEVFTLFPQVFPPYLETSILKRAKENNLLEVNLHNIRDWAEDKHHTTDDTPYGGGGGMVMKPEPIYNAINSVLGIPPACPLILLTPQGETFTQQKAEMLSKIPRLALICGRYEGFDERIRQHLITEELSIGDYVLSGGELPALVIIEAVTRLIPGALGDPDGAFDDSFGSGLLEYPQYTRPPEFQGWQVPAILQSGDHSAIHRWRRDQALLRTLQKRPDLLVSAELDKADLTFLKQVIKESVFPIPDSIINIITQRED